MRIAYKGITFTTIFIGDKAKNHCIDNKIGAKYYMKNHKKT